MFGPLYMCVTQIFVSSLRKILQQLKRPHYPKCGDSCSSRANELSCFCVPEWCMPPYWIQRTKVICKCTYTTRQQHVESLIHASKLPRLSCLLIDFHKFKRTFKHSPRNSRNYAAEDDSILYAPRTRYELMRGRILFCKGVKYFINAELQRSENDTTY